MQGQRREAELAQRIGHLVHVLAGVAEHHRRFGRVPEQQPGERLLPVRRLDLEEQVLDRRGFLLAVDGDFHRVIEQGARQFADGIGERGREQQALPLLVGAPGDLTDGLLEAHVEHAVGLVEHQGVEAVDLQRALAQVLLHAPRCADDDVGTMLQRADLRAEGHTATQGQYLDVVGGARQTADLLGDLVGQLACRAQHQRLATEVARVERVQQADAEGGGLAAAGLGLGDQIPALENQRQAGGLDRRHLGIADGGEVGLHGGGKGQAGEGVGGHGRSSGMEKQAGSVAGPLIRPLKPRCCARLDPLSRPVAERSQRPASTAGRRTGRWPGTPAARARCRPAHG